MSEKIIIEKLKKLGLEMSKQDNRCTANPLWFDCNRSQAGTSNCFSFFESDINLNENNFVVSNYQAIKMKELQNLLIELSKYEESIQKIEIFEDFKFNGIDCLISKDKQTLGFFKSFNDTRPSQATYIKKEDAEVLYKHFLSWENFKNFQKEEENED